MDGAKESDEHTMEEKRGITSKEEEGSRRPFRPYPLPVEDGCPRGMVARAKRWLDLRLFQVYIATALYMLDPWERFLFNAVAFAILIAVGHTTVVQVKYLIKLLVHWRMEAS